MSGDRQEWQIDRECPHCHDIIYSRYDGEYRTCKCGALAVDQTPYYERWIGCRPYEQTRTD